MKTNIIKKSFLAVSAFFLTLTLQAYEHTFSNHAEAPIWVHVRYKSPLCSDEKFTLNHKQYKTISAGACILGSIQIRLNNSIGEVIFDNDDGSSKPYNFIGSGSWGVRGNLKQEKYIELI